jgi:dipeptidyl aminopeptidase/acylaminoacyl peptidase
LVVGRWSFVPSSGRIITEFDLTPDGGAVFVAGAADNPCELYLRRPDGSERRLTVIHERYLAQRRVAPFEEIVYRAPDGYETQGWVVRPPDFDPARHYPLAVHIHGGPHVMWGPGFRSMWHELQVMAASGYVVFFCNPRGAEGYGRAWRGAVERNWGWADQDILAGIDAVLARGGVDPARIAVTGGSYGGYMTAWLIAQSDRFACAVAARGVYNLLTEHSTSDVHELIELEFGGFPWEVHDLLWQQSPLAHAHKITTPLLILHAELDYRVPIAEAEQLFGVLRRRRQTVELVRYPREGHELTRSGEPRHRADHMRRTLEWFDRYCR